MRSPLRRVLASLWTLLALLTLRNVEVTWDRETPEPKWGSALVLRDISNLVLQDFHGQAARPDAAPPAILKEKVTRRRD